MVISHLVGYFSCHAHQTHSLLCWIGFTRLKHQWDRSQSVLKWCDGYECALEVIVCSLHLHNAGKVGSCVSVVCSYSLYLFVKWMVFSICSMVVDDVHFLCFFLFSSWFGFAFEFAWFDDIEWVRMNGSCLLKNENEWNLVWEWKNKLNFNFLLLSVRERNAVFSSFSIFRHSSNDIFESRRI